MKYSTSPSTTAINGFKDSADAESRDVAPSPRADDASDLEYPEAPHCRVKCRPPQFWHLTILDLAKGLF